MKSLKDALRAYGRKQDFSRTPEPSGSRDKPKRSHPQSFVIQRHSAFRLHYDFRLEVQGVLKSWVVPKGLPETLHAKRLAVETEDHPLEYLHFEGTIPEGAYGAGTVKIWDIGLYKNKTYDKGRKLRPVEQALAGGHFLFTLQGTRLKGESFLLQRFGGPDKRKWLLVKTN